jgi:1,4-dihydroxy-2-naphthoate polyprenyltransferase
MARTEPSCSPPCGTSPAREYASSWARAGLLLEAVTSWRVLLFGAAVVAAAWFSTGGSRPYGYRGLGEVSVFIFFGVGAVAGTAFIQMSRLSWLGLLASVPAGLLSCALFMINNLRDIRSDAATGKRTLAVLLGDAGSRIAYVSFLLVPFGVAAVLAVARPLTLLTMLALPLTVPPVGAVRGGAAGPALIRALGQTARAQLVFGMLFTLGLAVKF